MSSYFKEFASDSEQPKEFSFTSENLKEAKVVLKRYPKDYPEGALMPLLTLAQKQSQGWLPKKAIEYIASFLNVSEIKVLEIATFYSMYNLSPVGKNHIEVCTTTPCMLRGSDNILKVCEKFLNINSGSVTKDRRFSLTEVECLGACVNAPIIKIDQDYFEDLDSKSTLSLLNGLAENKTIKKGSQIMRKGTEPIRRK